VINVSIPSGSEMRKNRKMVIRKKKLKKGKKKRLVEVKKVEGGKLLKEVLVEIGLKQKDDKKEIIVEALLNSGMIELVMSSEFVRKNKFKKKKLDRPIYVRNMNSTLNYKGLIEHTVKLELFYKEHKERTEVDMIKQ